MKSLLFSLLLWIAPLFIYAQKVIIETERLVIKENAHGETLLHLNDPNNNISNNTFLGYNAGQFTNSNFFLSEGAWNTFVGHNSGASNTIGSENTLLGYNSGNKIVDGYRNAYIGACSGEKNVSGHDNVILGAFGGFKMTSGSDNTLLGRSSGGNKTGGENNTFIGYEAGENNSNGSNNIFIGNEAGKDESGSNKLYISNYDTPNPLIYGDFDIDLIRINGALEIEQVKQSGELGDKIYANSVPLAYGYISSGGTITTDYGIKKVTNLDTGRFIIELDRNFTVNPVVLVTPYSAAIGEGFTATYFAAFPNTITVHIINEAGQAVDGPFSLMVMGW